ncbi:MAG: glycosyltransferase family 2 protein [Bacteroidales bacterium]|nr:glycosyltransferase family 2 protein [Bacteroidales bacterium]
MISICIPIHNYYAYPLVRRLTNQMEKLPEGEFELVCIDGCSSGYYMNQNAGIVALATYLRLKQNVGRARIRNLFLKYAKGDWLLFLDCDSLVPDNFLKNYLRQAEAKVGVVVGGRNFDKRDNDPEHRLRYLYGTEVECRPIDERQKEPYKHFQAGNFMIRRSVMERIKFDIRLTKYGYDGILFAYNLAQAKIPRHAHRQRGRQRLRGQQRGIPPQKRRKHRHAGEDLRLHVGGPELLPPATHPATLRTLQKPRPPRPDLPHLQNVPQGNGTPFRQRHGHLHQTVRVLQAGSLHRKNEIRHRNKKLSTQHTYNL